MSRLGAVAAAFLRLGEGTKLRSLRSLELQGLAHVFQKGVNVLDRGSQVHFMAEFQALLDFPPAPKLDIFGRLDPKKATDAEKRGEKLFFGKARCAECHPAPYFTDNTMHNLRVERFYKPQMVNGRMASADGPINLYNAATLAASATVDFRREGFIPLLLAGPDGSRRTAPPATVCRSGR